MSKRQAQKKNAFYAQSGGVTAVINATACGVIETARQNKKHIDKVYAGRNGIIGALTEDLIDTSKKNTIKNSSITDSLGWGLNVYSTKNVDIKNTIIYDS